MAGSTRIMQGTVVLGLDNAGIGYGYGYENHIGARCHRNATNSIGQGPKWESF